MPAKLSEKDVEDTLGVSMDMLEVSRNILLERHIVCAACTEKEKDCLRTKPRDANDWFAIDNFLGNLTQLLAITGQHVFDLKMEMAEREVRKFKTEDNMMAVLVRAKGPEEATHIMHILEDHDAEILLFVTLRSVLARCFQQLRLEGRSVNAELFLPMAYAALQKDHMSANAIAKKKGGIREH